MTAKFLRGRETWSSDWPARSPIDPTLSEILISVSRLFGIRRCPGLDTWLFTLGFRWTSECILAASFLAFIAFLFLTGFVTHIIARQVLRPV